MEAAEARAVSHFVLEKSKWWAGRGRGRKEVWLQGLCGGPSILGDAGMKGWALAASLDPWYSLADSPLSWVSGDLGSGNSFFFPLCPEVFCLLVDLKGRQDFSQPLAANKAHWRPEVHIARAAWICYGEQKVAKRSPRLQA